VLDSRRLTGPNLLSDRPGAVIDLRLAGDEGFGPGDLVALWGEHARAALEAVGWGGERAVSRVLGGGLSLAISAPMDALYAATEVNEWAVEAARCELTGSEPVPLARAVPELRRAIERESSPPLLALRAEAARRGLSALSDDRHLSIGLGRGSRTWPVTDLPAPDAVDWGGLHDVPVALVTGTNGKSTTVRLLAAIAQAAGRVPGLTSTDWIAVGERRLEEGDWSGPGGARRVLREPEVEVAILETARGGILRRGLPVARAEAGVVTNVAADHLGEWGVADVAELAEAKLVVGRAARRLALNADDPELSRRAGEMRRPVTWFGLDPGAAIVRSHLAAGGDACLLEDGALVVREGSRARVIARVDEVPVTQRGAARFNVANALAAVAAARELGFSDDEVARGLRGFESGPEGNPGRLNVFELGGVTAVVDFAHNPHGLAAVMDMARALHPRRVLVVLGQAGDRDDDSIRELARVTAAARPDRVIVKHVDRYLRGRPRGEVPALIEAELRRCGLPDEAIGSAPDEVRATLDALEWAREGDLLLLLSHAERESVIACVERARDRGWRPGQPPPG
jgi:UDP-N-acetylmuramyl tripeptide synthase